MNIYIWNLKIHAHCTKNKVINRYTWNSNFVMRKNKAYIGILEIEIKTFFAGFLPTWFGSQICWCTTGPTFELKIYLKANSGRIFFFFFSADEKFDGSFPTNVIVSDTGLCSYLPPGIFKVFFSLVEPHCWPFGMKFVIFRSHLFQTSSISVNMQDWHHLVSIWRAELRHEVWKLDLRWI